MGAHALLANGSVMAPVGAHLVALAAKRHSVPFVVLAGLHKLSPLFPHDPSVTFNDFQVCLPRMSFSHSALHFQVHDRVFEALHPDDLRPLGLENECMTGKGSDNINRTGDCGL